jgi:hypothetical protein
MAAAPQAPFLSAAADLRRLDASVLRLGSERVAMQCRQPKKLSPPCKLQTVVVDVSGHTSCTLLGVKLEFDDWRTVHRHCFMLVPSCSPDNGDQALHMH